MACEIFPVADPRDGPPGKLSTGFVDMNPTVQLC